MKNPANIPDTTITRELRKAIGCAVLEYVPTNYGHYIFDDNLHKIELSDYNNCLPHNNYFLTMNLLSRSCSNVIRLTSCLAVEIFC